MAAALRLVLGLLWDLLVLLPLAVALATLGAAYGCTLAALAACIKRATEFLEEIQ